MPSRGTWPYFSLDRFGGFVLGLFEVVLHLKAEPEIRGCSQVAREAQRGISRDGALALDDLEDARRRHVQIERQPVDAGVGGSHKFFTQQLTRVNGSNFLWHGTSPLKFLPGS